MKKSFILFLFAVCCIAVEKGQAQTNTFPTTGYVGIGTTSPSSRLHISNAIAREALRVYLEGNTTNYLNIWQGSGGAAIDPIGTGLLYLGYDQSTNVIMGMNGGKIGIGTTSIPDKLTIAGGTIGLYGNGLDGSLYQRFVTYADTQNGLYFDAPKDAVGNKLNIQFNWRGGGTPPFFIQGSSANVGIGTTTPDYKLTVNGKIKAEEVQVVVDVPADYVFEKDYALMPLIEVEQFVTENKHLPGMPDAQSLITNGWQVGEMNNKLLEKVEELTLYMIQLKKENEELKKRMEKMESKK